MKQSPYARPAPAPAGGDEDWAPPESAEYSTAEGDAGRYGYDDEPAASRGDVTRVAPLEASEAEERPADEDDNPDATRAGPPVTLEIVEGPDKGKRKRFKGVRMVLGRAQGIDVELSDQSVSRRHVELVMGEGGVVLRDLGSGNGTRVNDERVEERLLEHGDVIALGKTRIRLVDEQKQIEQLRAEAENREVEEKRRKQEAAAAAKKAAAERTAGRSDEVDPNDPRLNEATVARYIAPAGLQDAPLPVRPARGASPVAGMSRVKLAAIGVFGLVVLMLLTVILAVGRTTPAPPPPDPKAAKATALMQQAWNALRSEQYADAIRLAEQAERIVPGSDAQNLAKGARTELTIQEGLQQTRTLMDGSRYEEARTALKALPQGTAKSGEAKDKLMKDLEAAEAQFLAKQVLELIDARDAAGARLAIAKLPIVSQGPYLGQVAQLEEQLVRQAQDEQKQERTNKVNSTRRANDRRKELLAEAFSDVERKFHGGDFRGAGLMCDRVADQYKADKDIRERARTLKKLIPQFQLNFEDGERKFKANSMEASVKPLRKAADLFREIGFSGSLGETINEMLGAAALSAGKTALARNDVANAGSYFREARRLNPGDARAQAGLDSIQGKMEELYLQGYILKDRDPKAAAEKFRIVIETAAEDSEVKRKAESQLSALQP
ncbi:FHA domain-containing protein [Myxococcaceae bacterium GXIMD 01537]